MLNLGFLLHFSILALPKASSTYSWRQAGFKLASFYAVSIFLSVLSVIGHKNLLWSNILINMANQYRNKRTKMNERGCFGRRAPSFRPTPLYDRATVLVMNNLTITSRTFYSQNHSSNHLHWADEHLKTRQIRRCVTAALTSQSFRWRVTTFVAKYCFEYIFPIDFALIFVFFVLKLYH